jgi:cell division protein FtsW
MSERKAPDMALIAVAAILTAIGAIMVFSASSVAAYTKYLDATHYLKRELAWVALGAVALWFGCTIDYGKLRKAAPWLLALAVTLLAAVLVPKLGAMEGGARRWFEFGAGSFEPSEFAKIALVIFLAKIIAESPDGARSFRRIGFPAIFAAGLCFALVVMEPDLGTAMLFAMTAGIMLFVGGAPLVQLIVEGLVAAPAVLAFVYSSPYRHARFTAFLNPWKDPQGTGYHVIQSLYALGSGGIFGLGLGESRQKFGYLPAQFTDFIFAIIGEELGFIGAATVLALFLFVAYRGVRIAMKAEDRFGFFLAIGITATIVAQALVNIGVVTSTWPVTGVPLPFVSYGGTSLVVTLFGVGLLASVSRGRSRAVVAAESRQQDIIRASRSRGRRHGRSYVPRAFSGAGALRRAR